MKNMILCTNFFFCYTSYSFLFFLGVLSVSTPFSSDMSSYDYYHHSHKFKMETVGSFIGLLPRSTLPSPKHRDKRLALWKYLETGPIQCLGGGTTFIPCTSCKDSPDGSLSSWKLIVVRLKSLLPIAEIESAINCMCPEHAMSYHAICSST